MEDREPVLGDHQNGSTGVEIWDGKSWVPLQEAMERVYSISSGDTDFIKNKHAGRRWMPL